MKKAVIIILMALTGRLSTQSDSTTLAHELFAQGRYGESELFLNELLIKNPNDPILNLKMGICYLHSRSQKHKAVSYLEKSIEYSSSLQNKNMPDENGAPAIVFKYLGDAYRATYRFYNAINAYEKYKELIGKKKPDVAEIARVDQCIELCQFGKEVQESTLPVKLNIHELVKTGNTVGYYTSAISPSNTETIHTWKVPTEKTYKDDSRYFETKPIGKDQKFTSEDLKNREAEVNFASRKKDKLHDTIVNITTIGTSVDGQVMLTYRDEKGSAVIYISKLAGNKWSTPVRLPKTVNKGGWEPCEYVSFDGNYLYFVSDRTGGYGGKDIYRCERLANGEWGKARNLGPDINTEYDEEAPFLHQDGTTLYFSSNRNKPALSYEIFASTLKDSTWQKSLIVGYPINSSDEDVFYQVAADKKRIYAKPAVPAPGLTEKENTKKKGSLHGKKARKQKQQQENNHYLITFLNPQMSALTILKGEVVEKQRKTEKPIQATITVTDNNSGKCQGIYFTDLSRGAYSFVVPAEKSNNITFEADGYLFCSENIAVKTNTNYFEKYKAIYLQPLKEGSHSELNNIFFEKDRAVLHTSSNAELEKLYHFLNNNPEMKININSYIYSEKKYYKPLSEERASAIVKYLEEKGIDKERLTAKGYRKSLTNDHKDILSTDEYVQKIEIEIDDIPNSKKNKS
jgi:outer membrane protein OmpA-like peptidoglycan-associated protein